MTYIVKEIENLLHLSPLPYEDEDTVRRQPFLNEEESPQWGTELAGTLMLAYPDPRTVRKNSCCLSHPICSVLLQQPGLTDHTPYFSDYKMHPPNLGGKWGCLIVRMWVTWLVGVGEGGGCGADFSPLFSVSKT